jgi:hypothetical protein
LLVERWAPSREEKGERRKEEKAACLVLETAGYTISFKLYKLYKLSNSTISFPKIPGRCFAQLLLKKCIESSF